MPDASIFLVEDEALVRMSLASMVEELGHRVVAEAGTIKEAGAAVWKAIPTDAGRQPGSRESAAESGGAQRSKVPFDPNPGVAAQALRSDFGRWHQRVIPAS